MKYAEHFKGKKITLMGLGLLGRGIGDARFLAKNGADLIVTDTKTKKELKESIDELKGYKNITFHVGGHDLKDFTGRDLIVKSASVPLKNIYIEEAQKWEIPITMSTALAVKLSRAITIGVTGTKGKSTVTTLIHHILSEYSDRVFLGGNIRGVSTLEMLDDIRAGDILVLELDSWQLQGFEYEKISPHISVFTNFMRDHMSYYNDDMDLYFKDKANIFKYQTKNDHLVLGESMTERVGKQEAQIHVPYAFWKHDVPEVETLPGEHNKENIALAMKVAQLLGISDEQILKALKRFPGVPGRLEKLRVVNDVTYYNDNNATVPAATIAGIEALARTGHLILIAGGHYKDVDPYDLVKVINEYTKGIILIPGSGTEELLKYDIEVPIRRVDTLEEAVFAAHKNAKPGDVVLFSPAFSSFNMFANEYERNDLYVKLVEGLK